MNAVHVELHDEWESTDFVVLQDFFSWVFVETANNSDCLPKVFLIHAFLCMEAWTLKIWTNKNPHTHKEIPLRDQNVQCGATLQFLSSLAHFSSRNFPTVDCKQFPWQMTDIQCLYGWKSYQIFMLDEDLSTLLLVW